MKQIFYFLPLLILFGLFSPDLRAEDSRESLFDRRDSLFGDREGAKRGKDAAQDDFQALPDSRKDDLFQREEASWLDLEGGVPVVALRAILTGTDENEFDEQYDELLDAAEAYDLPIAFVYLYPNDKIKLTDLQKVRQAAYGGLFASAQILPDRYKNIQSVPSWLIETKDGEFIYEGVKLERLFNRKGDLIEERALEFMEQRKAKQ